MADQIYIQRRFDVDVPGYGTLSDAITLLQADYNALTPANIITIKATRVASWKAAIDAARNAPRPTRAQRLAAILARRADLQAAQDQLDAEQAQLDNDPGP